nr:MAG TPA: Pyocin activator protein PrtN [Caudoviricetes sp.]
MTTTRPEVTMTGRYPIGEAAKKLGVHRDTLRARIKDGSVKCRLRKDNMRKVILGSEIIRFWEQTF